MRRSVISMLAVLLTSGVAVALNGSQVLVVYDSTTGDSILVAEHYAGSAKVPGGLGNVPGAHPDVHVLDLDTASVAAQVSYGQYISRFRDPIRDHLSASGLEEQIRCLVLCKGVAHRIRDTDSTGAGDNPTTSFNQFDAGDATYASVDSELTLLWQDLDAGENGNTGDSKSDGVILNPYHQADRGIGAWSSRAITDPKLFQVFSSLGQYWRTIGGLAAVRIRPGDMLLVCRLDGHTVDDVRGMIDRAQDLTIDLGAVTWVLDESDRGGADPNLDDDGLSLFNTGPDFERTEAALLTDDRVTSGNVAYNDANGAAGFSVGPLLGFDGEGLLIPGDVILLAHEGANHLTPHPGAGAGADPAATTLYAESFNYAPGACFNSIESFNGRAFAGLGDLGQEQAADFIGAGGTFAIASVYEPFTIALPDNEFIVRNFYLGTLTWGEAAYTALPFLSWTQIVLGDPLARVTRTSEDLDADGRVTIDDLIAWTDAPVDVDGDGVADESDRALLESVVRANERAQTPGSTR